MTSENLAADQKCLARVVSPKIVCNIMMGFFFFKIKRGSSFVYWPVLYRQEIK